MAPYFLITGQPLSGKTTLTGNLLTALQASGYEAALLPVSEFFTALATRISEQAAPPDELDLRSLAQNTPFETIAAPPAAAPDPTAPRLELIINHLTKKRIVHAVLGQNVRNLLDAAPKQKLYLLDSPIAPYFAKMPPPLLGIILHTSHDARVQRLMSRYNRANRPLNSMKAESIIVRHDTIFPASVTLTEYFGKIAEVHTKTDGCQPDVRCASVLKSCLDILKNRLSHPEPDLRNIPLPAGL